MEYNPSNLGFFQFVHPYNLGSNAAIALMVTLETLLDWMGQLGPVKIVIVAVLDL